jgi:hypothetical protein
MGDKHIQNVILAAMFAIATYVKTSTWPAICGGRNANGVNGFGRGIDESLADMVSSHWGMFTWVTVPDLSLCDFLYRLDEFQPCRPRYHGAWEP